jgi:uncharacterized protein (DUF1501 family)
MFHLTVSRSSTCRDLTRRHFLKAGFLGVGGLTLPDLFRAQAAGAARKRDTSVILLWLSGGPGHMETWDPKPDAVAQYRGPFGAIATCVPGIQLGELLPRQARIANRLAFLRSVNHGTGDHTKANHWMLTAYPGPDFNASNLTQRKPSLGSCITRLHGPNQPGMPPYVAVPHLRGGTDNFYHYAASLGGAANPFIVDSDPNKKDFKVRGTTLPPNLNPGRLEDRRGLLKAMDQLRRAGDRHSADRDEYYQQAFALLTSPRVAQAFDIDAEVSRTRDAYGRHTFGQSALLARRLIEAGTTFVTVNCIPERVPAGMTRTWDHHGTGGRAKTEPGSKFFIPPMDQALTALIEDLIQRGLYERTLVVCMGEFGRTPRMNADGGRDHWGNVFSVVMGCGAMKMGQVIGKSTPRGETVRDRPISPADVAATIYHHLGIDARSVTVRDPLGRPTFLLDQGEAIWELLTEGSRGAAPQESAGRKAT